MTIDPHSWLESTDLDASSVEEVNRQLATEPAPTGERAERLRRWLARVQAHLRQERWGLTEPTRHDIARIYRRWGESWPANHQWLVVLAADQSAASLRLWRELLLEQPPSSGTHAAEAFAPLVARLTWDPDALYPALLDGLNELSIAPLILDLANLLVRRGRVDTHPARSRTTLLASLLGQLAERLGVLEEQAAGGPLPAGAGRRIADSVSLAISCTDALALIGDHQATPALFKTLDVGHRRLQVEAAYALSRLQEPAGRERLVELSAEPLVRQRVLAYASELGLLDEIPAQMRSERSRAEAELVQYLAMPTQFGLPPSRWEIVDQRTLRWPGFDEPITVFLFTYDYVADQGVYANRAIVGPCTRAPRLDLRPLTIAATLAYFAGWQAEHESIRSLGEDQLSPRARQSVDELLASVPAGLAIDRVEQLWQFFDQLHVICTARQVSQTPPVPGTLVLAHNGSRWFPSTPGSRALDPIDWYDVFKGAELLSAFNPDYSLDQPDPIPSGPSEPPSDPSSGPSPADHS